LQLNSSILPEKSMQFMFALQVR